MYTDETAQNTIPINFVSLTETSQKTRNFHVGSKT